MNPLLALLVAGAVLGAGTHVGLVAAAFLVAPWQQTSPGASGLGSMLFAPFALLALVLPLAAIPLARKLGVGDSARNPGMVVTGLVLWIGDEGSFLALSLAGGGDPQAVPGIAHAMLFAYAILAAMLLKRRMRHGESIPEPE
ncbi:MAG: hypothetical protein U1F52_08335 [Burkholderiales bacterium]